MIKRLAVFAFLLLSACTLRIGWPSRSTVGPAPTAVPLQAAAGPADLPGLALPQNPVSLPPGFAINVFIQGLSGTRMMAFGPDGYLYVADRGSNRVLRFRDTDGDGDADSQQTVGRGLRGPNSLAFYQDGSLYVGLVDSVVRLSQPDDLGAFQQRQVIIDGLPSEGHNTRTVLFSPDYRYLYISIGSSCNVCLEGDPRRAAIVRYEPDGSAEQVYARGLRNAVGITFRPGTSELWSTNNGRDLLGDDQPPDTVQMVKEGDDFGWPRCHAGRIADPDFGGQKACQGVVKPQVELDAHSAPLGLTFYNGDQFPEEYRGGLFIAYHGSWNRSEPTGYKVVFIPFSGGKPGPVQDFAVGWLVDGSSWGRPVDVVVGPDGSLFVSDDAGGVVYRIFYRGGI
jgi:glucose/arabinose dehydrogenase